MWTSVKGFNQWNIISKDEANPKTEYSLKTMYASTQISITFVPEVYKSDLLKGGHPLISSSLTP